METQAEMDEPWYSKPTPRTKEKRPHWEREELLQVAMLGAIFAKPELAEKVEPAMFTSPWSTAVAAIQEALKGNTAALDGWLERNLGIERKGDKVIDAALERLIRDAAYRAAEKVDGYEARVARLMLAFQDKRGT